MDHDGSLIKRVFGASGNSSLIVSNSMISAAQSPADSTSYSPADTTSYSTSLSTSYSTAYSTSYTLSATTEPIGSGTSIYTTDSLSATGILPSITSPPSTSTTSAGRTSSQTSTTSSGGHSSAAKIGIGLGVSLGVIILALIFLGVYWGVRRQEQKQRDRDESLWPSWPPPELQAYELGCQEWKGIEIPTQAYVAELPSAKNRW